MDVWLALEHSALGEAMRRSAVLYPAANVAHILALLVFFSAVSAMDARLLGAFRDLSWRQVAGTCRPVAMAAFAVQAATGLLLLAPDAVALAGNPAFRLKMATIALALVNVVALQVVMRRSPGGGENGAAISLSARVCAAVSLLAWLATATLGRLIAYV